MNSIKRKLRSERGASITFALLIFLVCSMVSIAVVVAGSAAAGRMSQRAETDQRYYAVTSAVELLCDDFKGKTVTVEYTHEVGVLPTKESISTTGIINKDGPAVTDITKCGMLVAASEALVYKIANPTAATPVNPTAPDAEFTLTAETKVAGEDEGGEDEEDPDANFSLGCGIKEYIKTDGRVIFQISNSSGTQTYTLQAILNANLSASSSQYKTVVTVGEEEQEKTMEKVVYTLTWTLSGIEKGSVY